MEKRLLSLCFIFLLALACDSTSGQSPPDEPFPCTKLNPFSDPNVAGGKMCAQFYGLCIGAPCESIGQTPLTGFEGDTFIIGSGTGGIGDIIGHAVCKCPFINGNSIGKAPCEDRAPDDAMSISTYSFQFNNDANRLLSCDQKDFNEDLRFADCYNQPCVTDPEDPTMVICTCPVFPVDVTPDDTYLTRGGDCNQNNCTELWSAATNGTLPFVDQAMACGIGNPEPAAQFNCP